MRLMSLLLLSSAATLAWGTQAQAADAPAAAEQHSAAAVYEGVNSNGQRVRLTISDNGPDVLVRVDRREPLPDPNWTALIGTGKAASSEP